MTNRTNTSQQQIFFKRQNANTWWTDKRHMEDCLKRIQNDKQTYVRYITPQKQIDQQIFTLEIVNWERNKMQEYKCTCGKVIEEVLGKSKLHLRRIVNNFKSHVVTQHLKANSNLYIQLLEKTKKRSSVVLDITKNMQKFPCQLEFMSLSYSEN